MRLTAKISILGGITAFAVGIGWMVLVLLRAVEMDATASATGFAPTVQQSTGVVLLALAGYLVAVAGSSVFRSVAAHRPDDPADA